ncbi:hypothetical protein TNCV_3609751 [Trichonephila clavipes]|nr:hypothetical protein TNCV_3609751 [Trichonephila clavipes]
MTFNSEKLPINRNRKYASYTYQVKGNAWECLTSSKPVVPEFTFPVAVVLLHLLTQHGRLKDHLFKIQLKDTSTSTLCDSGESMDEDHIDKCTALLSFNSIVFKYWEARSRLMD